MAKRIVKYTPPKWASSLKHVPKSTVQLAMKPTPIYDWDLSSTPDQFKLYIKRDDLTGSVLTGNKVRKLEFLLADAIQRSCKHVVTAGAVTSNHCRATTASSVELGLRPHLFLRTNACDVADVNIDGNFLLNTLFGADIYLQPYSLTSKEIYKKMQEFAKDLEEKTGEKAAVIPVGGTNVTGKWGYIQCFEEIRQQGVEFDDLLVAAGSMGTVVGLAIANYLCGSPYRVHGVDIGTNGNAIEVLTNMLEVLGITDATPTEMVTIYKDYIGLGYALSRPGELEFIAQVVAETGILLDTAYTGKAAYGLTDLMKNRPEVFKGRRVLFLHTGGSIAVHSAAVSSSLLPYCTKGKITMGSES